MKKIGIFSFTCCEGCVIVFIETLNTKYKDWIENKKIKIENFRALKKVKLIKQLDIALIEGAISTKSEIKKLKEIRTKTKVLIAIGSGAINGWPSNQRNKFNQKKQKEIQPLIKKLNQNKTIEPLNKFVKIDDQIPCCPIEEETLIKKIESYLN